jgi:hypothetical protein
MSGDFPWCGEYQTAWLRAALAMPVLSKLVDGYSAVCGLAAPFARSAPRPLTVLLKYALLHR